MNNEAQQILPQMKKMNLRFDGTDILVIEGTEFNESTMNTLRRHFRNTNKKEGVLILFSTEALDNITLEGEEFMNKQGWYRKENE